SKLGLPLTDYAEQRSGYERVLLDIADKFPNVQYRPLFQNICNERLCPLFDGKTLLFRDGDHLSWKGALKLVDAARDLLVKDVQSPASPGEAAKLRLWAAPR
ncbi:MAG: SGNH hydrolase domain-containing protein, partial [Gimesia chilikensis]